MAGTTDTSPRGIFVLGMHRSGTSATMRALTLLGISACVESDYIPGRLGNPRGHFESATLMRVNQELLRRSGGFWWVPPPDEALERAGSDPQFTREAREAFLGTHPTSQWACKDPRCCLTLSFWARALELSPIVIAMSRNPLEVASSLHKRDGTAMRLGLAIWERYTRSMLLQMRGRRVFLSDYDDLLTDPERWCEQVHSFLADAGVRVGELDPAPVVRSLEPGLRHRRLSDAELAGDRRLTEVQRQIYEIARARAGREDSFAEVSLPAEDGAMAREFQRVRRIDGRLRRRWQGRRRGQSTSR